MITFVELSALSPFPTVNLRAISIPRDGIVSAVPSSCRRNFSRDDSCKRHYEKLITAKPGEIVPCPYGFSSMLLPVTVGKIAMTAFVPFPRSGGDEERAMAKRHPETRVSADGVQRAAQALVGVEHGVARIEEETNKRHAMALHEIRKLNRTVKQGAERLCRLENATDPDQANPSLVQIWKTSDLMSRQFDIIDILANEAMTELPVEKSVEPYKLADKCVRIYRPAADAKGRKLVLRSNPVGFSPRLVVCDSTFSLIFSVLIENAIKYSIKGTEVLVEIQKLDRGFRLSVSNVGEPATLTPEIFGKGVRASNAVEGSGNGLYVAQLVARQHHTEIVLSVEALSASRSRYVFSLDFGTGA